MLTLRALARGRRLLVVALLLAVPALLSIAYIASQKNPNGGSFVMTLFDQMTLPVLLPLTALIFATSALGGEIEDRTLLYLTLRPVSRLAVVVGKLIAATALTVALVEVSLAVTYLIAVRGLGDAQNLGAIQLAGLAGCLAYSSLFLLIGLLAPRRALLIGFIYVLAWEGFAAGLSTALATASLRRYVEGALHAWLGHSSLAALQPSSVGGTTSAAVLALVLLGGIALTTLRLRRMELP